MKIVHIAPNSPYNDYWGYQENLLPKYQKKSGNEVTIIVTNTMYQDGHIIETNCEDYILSDGVRVIRRKYKKYLMNVITGVFSFIPVYDLLNEIQPDLIFYHGLVSCTIFDVIKYKRKHDKCKIVQDNHMDYNIGNKRHTIKEKIICLWLRFINKKSIKYVTKVYGVTPWRKAYAEDYFKIPNSKTDLLIMGADDENMRLDKKDMIRKEIRDKYKISDNQFLIVTGGKIDKKKKIDILMKACSECRDVTLLIFGSVSDEIKNVFDDLSKNTNIIYVGWIDSNKVYDYFYAADLVFFPGQHSVLWEQACASKVPCVFEKWDFMDHVNNGGNSDFITPITVNSIKNKINELKFTNKYFEMKQIAESSNTDVFLYSKIAKKSLENVKND